MKNNSDPRIRNALKIGLNEFESSYGEKLIWNINSIIGFGGSSITYLANMPQLKKQFILKEYFPHIFANDVIRVGTSLEIDASKKESWSNGLIHFKEEIKLQDELPLSSTDGGGELFIYAIDHFSANKTEYIVFDTDGSITLKDYFENLHEKINETPSQNNKRDNAYLKTLLQSTITVCEALSALHNRNWLHMDISDTNILIHPKSQKVHLTDLASAVKYDPEKVDYSDVTTSYTPSFSPIEQKSLSLGNRKVLLNFECDTYSLCAVLYKCLFDNPYDPIINDLDLFLEDNAFVETPKIPLCPNLSEPLKKKLILILKTGLSGMGYRYKTACELCDVLCNLLEKIKKEESSVNKSKQALIYGGAASVIIIFSLILGFWLIPTRPTISAEVDSIYTEGETIEFDITLYDSNNGSPSLTSDCLDNIKTNGFNASQKEFELIDATDNTSVCRIRLKDISAENNGEKSITIGKIYKSFTAFGKYNEPLELDFYYGPNIRCSISEPSVTKVNSDAGHNIKYLLTFDSPIDFEISIDTVGLCGFEAAEITSTSLGNNQVSLTFVNVSGDVGDNKYFVMYEKTAYADETHYLKQTKSPTFSIVEEEVTNAEIYVVYSVLQKDIRDGGFVILSPSVMNASDYQNNTIAADITLNGFEAAIKVSGEDIVLYNLQLPEEIDELSVSVKAGTIVSYNGSRSKELKAIVNESQPADTSIPALALSLISNKQEVEEQGTVMYKLAVADNSDYVLFSQSDLTQYIDLVGFKGEVSYKKVGRICYIIVSYIQPDGSGEMPHIVIKEGIAIDDAGNKSHQIGSPAFKFK